MRDGTAWPGSRGASRGWFALAAEGGCMKHKKRRSDEFGRSACELLR
jgi:hypothetical protein